MKLKSKVWIRKNSEGIEDVSFDFLLQKFMEDLNKLVEFESGSLFLIDKMTYSLKEVASKGNGIDFINTVHFPLGTGLSAWVAQKGKLIYLPDIHRGSRHGENPVRSYLSMPLEINNKILGVLNLGHIIPHAFDGKEIEQIETYTKEITRKIYNHLYLKIN
ncbi:MAG: GAF domain-containing protein [bacterium]